MCGIAGTLGLADKAIVRRMIEAMAHRGPDDSGFHLDEQNRIAFGHCRLSIIDLSPAAHQPMSYANDRYWITYNGEVYNFAQVRVDLEHKGYLFASNSDTEVILAAYAEYGPSCLDHFRGMFALAVWDRDERKLFLARDRFGIKPLYWTQANGVFLFSSELKGILASGLVPRQLNPDAVWQYLSLGSVPAPQTILTGVTALLPGHYMVIEDQRVDICRYWDFPASQDGQNTNHPVHPIEVERELRRLLEESIRLHMISDVPVGAFLSGGIDSTAVVGLMSQELDRPLKTFSIGFEGVGQEISELSYAKVVAQRFGTDHHEVIVTGEDVAREFDQFIDAIDQPSVDGINTYFVSAAAREEVTVALSGLGGDELFAGYPHFRWLNIMERPFLNRNPFAQFGLHLLKEFGPNRWRKLAEFLGAGSYGLRYATARRLFAEEEKESLVSTQVQGLLNHQSLTDFYGPYIQPALDVIARTTYIETKTYMANTLLRDTDATGMSHALEVRVPLLDHVFAEFAFKMRPGLKLNGSHTKVTLVSALKDILPEETINHKKMGFEFPMRQWLAGHLSATVKETLTSDLATQLFSKPGIRKMIAQAEQAQHPYTKVWAPVVLTAWMQHNRCYV